ncbi:amino acid permease [Novacetimonas pomaceti]|uniref:GABA permease n=1 Tax=Novacetimonas pomaceti TaxID=2021998 RepID=A0A318QD68_9PROT|nr:amino acid permease [Novacetimonas pomaceti]PYD75212.1 GABA permease [Novacetimonas pomaceti]
MTRDTVSGHTLKNRHIAMIALGGVVGAGLFVGSSSAIAIAGPAVLLAYVLCGGLVMVVMRMLGEMVMRQPGRGSFVEYIRAAYGNRWGFVAGWMYWFFWVVAMGSEAIAGGLLVQDWTGLPPYMLAIGIILGLVAINLCAVDVFGECEFWLSLTKVASILLFVILGMGFVLHLFGPRLAVGANYLGHGGLAPNGIAVVLAVIPTIMFSMIGSEVATVAAAESANPQAGVARVTRSIGVRVTIFYLASVMLVLAIVPWDHVVPGKSPFVAAMTVMGVPGAATIMQLVVFSAILSCLNSSLYITSRILSELARGGNAPAVLALRSRQGAPRLALGASALAGLVVALCSVLSPNLLFSFLLSCSGGVILLVYMMIAFSYLLLMRGEDAAGRNWQGYLSIGGIGIVFVAMLLDPTERMTALASLMTGVFFVCLFDGWRMVMRRQQRARAGTQAGCL